MEVDHVQENHEVNFQLQAQKYGLPIVELTIGNKKIKCLIDTGSSTSLLDKDILKEYRRTKLKNPINFNTINGSFSIEEEIVTPLPIEFNESNYMCWKLTTFKNKDFNGLIGQNILKPLSFVINLEKEYILVNGTKTKFMYSCPFTYNEIHVLEKLENNDIFEKLVKKEMNALEIEMLKEIISNNDDLFFKEGQNLSHAHEVQHEIITTIDKPVYSKIYRYPQVHEVEITKQMKDMLEQGIIKESVSPYNSPLWIVPKKMDNSGEKKWRMVIDYRALNEITVSDKFPIPNIDKVREDTDICN